MSNLARKSSSIAFRVHNFTLPVEHLPMPLIFAAKVKSNQISLLLCNFHLRKFKSHTDFFSPHLLSTTLLGRPWNESLRLPPAQPLYRLVTTTTTLPARSGPKKVIPTSRFKSPHHPTVLLGSSHAACGMRRGCS